MNGQSQLSRREFAALVAAAAAGAASPVGAAQATPGAGRPTVEDVVARIRANLGVEWTSETVDGVKAGDPSTVVTGIATTAMATLAVLRRAQASGANLIVTAEPTFYARADARTPPAGRGGRGAGGAPAAPPPPPDPIFAAKNDAIASHALAVLRLNEHWKMRTPNPFAQGLGDALGWSPHRLADDVSRYEIPAVTLQALARHVKASLGSRGGVRVVGDPQARVRRVGLLPGSTPIAASLEMLPDVDAAVAGEVREWESVEYARDLAYAGKGKGLILVGRVVSEEPGMNLCATWLGSILPGISVRHVAAGDPYWRPA